MRIRNVITMAGVISAAVLWIDAQSQGPDPERTVVSPGAMEHDAKKPNRTVTVKPDPLRRSDRDLNRIKTSLPTGNTKALPEQSIGAELQSYSAAHKNPNSATGEQRKMMEREDNPPEGPDPDNGLTLDHQ